MLDLLASCAKCVLLDKRGEIPKESRIKGGAVIENLEGNFDSGKMDQDAEGLHPLWPALCLHPTSFLSVSFL